MTAENDDAAIRDLVRRANASEPHTDAPDVGASLADIMRRAGLGRLATLPSVEVVARAAQGDEHAWNELVHRYAPLVWQICGQFRLQDSEREDVAQSVWLSLVTELSKLPEPASLPGWLATVTRRECLRLLEHSRRQPDTAVAAVQEDALRIAFSRLQPRCQQLLVLLMQTPPLSYREIADRLDMPVGSIGPSRARCLAKLRRDPVLRNWIGLPE